MNLTHRQLEVLVAAADSESFSAAAERLGISQPSLSESIRRIEREVGVPLFKRTTRSVKLTDDGRHAVAVAREIVRDFKTALERLASRGSGKQGRISINSPIARALIGKENGDIVDAQTPGGVKQYEILDIRYG